MTDRTLLLCTAAIIEARGMEAENQQRTQHGYSLAYTENAFAKLAEPLRLELKKMGREKYCPCCGNLCGCNCQITLEKLGRDPEWLPALLAQFS